MQKAKRPHSPTTAAAIEHFKREKARRAGQRPPLSQQMEAARREYEALMIENAARGKGGRPKKKAQPARDAELDEMLDEVDGGADETPEDEAAEE